MIQNPGREHSPFSLPEPAAYIPLGMGEFRFVVGLRPLGAERAGTQDHCVFQLDRTWSTYRAAKLAARAENLEKYFLYRDCEPSLRTAACRLIADRLVAEHPRCFGRVGGEVGARLACALSGETFTLVPGGEVAEVAGGPAPAYRDGLDALASQLQEDIALVDADGRLVAVHVCFPNHWAPADRVGGDFMAVHAAVPAMDHIISAAPRLHAQLARGEPRVRFAWGLATDTRLNHHPVPPPGEPPDTWRGRAFDPARPELFLRIERQVVLPVPETGAYLFLIRSYFRDVGALAADERARLAAALRTMDADVLAYKGLAHDRAAILRWLAAPGT